MSPLMYFLWKARVLGFSFEGKDKYFEILGGFGNVEKLEVPKS